MTNHAGSLSGEITMHRYECGPYVFTGRLPRLGTSTDQMRWSATTDGSQVPGAFASLEEAMKAALDALK